MWCRVFLWTRVRPPGVWPATSPSPGVLFLRATPKKEKAPHVLAPYVEALGELIFTTCGLGHARMRGFVTVQTAEEFQKWMADAVAEAAAAASDPFR